VALGASVLIQQKEPVMGKFKFKSLLIWQVREDMEEELLEMKWARSAGDMKAALQASHSSFGRIAKDLAIKVWICGYL
jgi:hypothetical protein